MKIVMVSNFMTHHQLPLCEELSRLTDGNFTFVSVGSLPEERRKLGYQDYSECPFVVEYTPENRKEIHRIIYNCDVLICGSTPDKVFVPRVKAHKLTFRYSERPFKTKFNTKNFFHRAGSMFKHFMRYQNEMQYMLCASAYTAWDMSRFGCYTGRMYQWGYFPKTYYYNNISEVLSKKTNRIIWCGRMIEWKRPGDAIALAKLLRQNNIPFALDFIGTGELETQLKDTVINEGLSECVNFHGSMPPDEVRRHMLDAAIVLVTSNRREGWGAVVNEAMNSGCAVVGSSAAGSVPFLIKNGENGLIYKSEDTGMLYRHIRYLLNNPKKREQIGRMAYLTITSCWNEKIAAQRLIELSNAVLTGVKSPLLYENGPCAKAKIIRDSYYKNEINNIIS